MNQPFGLSRRRTLKLLSAGAVAPFLSSCAQGGGGGSTGSPRGEAAAPTYRKVESVTPDLPGDTDGVPDAYLSFPRESMPEPIGPPGKGGKLSAVIPISEPVVPGPPENQWWEQLNENLNLDVSVTFASTGDYGAKISTMVAGSDLPDLVHLGPSHVARLPSLLEAEFEDLTEHLSGDAILDFPFLANLPPYMWTSAMFEGRIRAVPPSNLVGQPTWVLRQDNAEQLGVAHSPTDADDVLEFAAALTDPGRNRYALADPSNAVNGLAAAMFAAPNNWRNDQGRFVHMVETDEYRAALDFVTKLWRQGSFHPDSFGHANWPELWRSGTISLGYWGGVAYASLLRSQIEGLKLKFWAPPKAEGGGPGSKRLGSGTWNLCAIRKQESPERVREILSALNYFAAPFGTPESLFLQYGVEGRHFEWDSAGNPVDTPEAMREIWGTTAIARAPMVLYDQGFAEVTRAMYDHQVDTIPSGERNHATGLYSETAIRDGSGLLRNLEDTRDKVIRGDASLADWDGAVDVWRSQGGDSMRQEYEEAYSNEPG